ncbi:MAG TPA: hypothetical protein VNT01_00565, partial [Symbiobacteriaceae bacterium]|nr:hypothetical protein [Symbiobacteriaceae bacterium]
SAKRGDTELIAVVLGAQNYLWTSSMQLLDYGFSHFQSRRIVQKGDAAGQVTVPGAGEIPVRAAADLWVALTPGAAEPEQRVVPQDGLKAPVAADAPVGKLVVSAGSQELGSVAVTAAQAAPAGAKPAAAPGKADRSWLWLLVAALPLVLLALLNRRKRSLS